MLTPEDILQVMDESVVSAMNIRTFLNKRPDAVDRKLTEFVVVALPYSAANRMLGENDDWWIDMTVTFEIFVADRKAASDTSEPNVPRMKALRLMLDGIFPIKNKEVGIKITRPRTVTPASSDGEGYTYTRIQAKMTTMV